MSGPFRFHQEEARSPLDRSASPFSAGQPVSFKTNVNRAKTKKWVQAKKNAYDGDDWGEYDEYDEYGVNQEPQQAQPRYYAQHLDQPSRSFTDPSHQAPLPRARRNSFEQGEEQRAFSSTIPHSQHGHIQPYEEPQGPAGGAAFGQDYDMGGRGDFSPTAVPPPLQTRISQVPADFAPPSNTQFPPRKSSIGQGDLPIGTSPRPRNGSGSDKPLPFIRPADTYKRHQDERTSLDSSRPSLDSLSSPSRDDAALGQEGGKSLHPMETVAERKSEYLADYDATAMQNDTQPQRQERPVISPPDHQDLRSVVDQAFTRTDDSRSVPPTPVSNDSGSDLLRSNTGSTSGISPIMSRVPSSAASALRSRNQLEGSTPVIAEEPSETTTPVTRPTDAHNIEAIHHVPRKPSPGHSRNFSNSSAPRSGLATPTRGDSPARSPVLAPSRDVPEPKSALFSTEGNDNSGDMEGGLQGPSSAYAAREADLAIQTKSRPNSGAPDLGAMERQSQTMFLDSHNAQSPIEDVLPRDRSESPSKGRVQALAGKFGEVASSRRGSTQSNRSRNSMQSWERSHDNSRAASPTKASPSKPSSPVKEFRPHLPGQWESYATTTMTPSEQGEQDRGLSIANNNNNQTALERSDLTPTTAKHSVVESTPLEANDSDPMAALRNAGAAMVDSIRTTLGADEHASGSQHDQKERGEHANVYLPRPLQLDRTITSNSSAPSTPPAKDMLEPELAPLTLLKESPSQPFKSQPDRPSLDPQLSTDPSAEDQESDRLRKEIVASLSPFKAPESPAGEPNDATLVPASPGTNRASSILPSEYKSYWAEEDRASRRSSQDSERNAQDQPPATVTFLPQSEEPTQPVIKRFSWEASNSQLQTSDDQPEKAPTAGTTVAPKEIDESSPVVERATEQDRQQPSEGLSDSYFGTDHTFRVTKPDPLGDPEKPVQPSPPLDPARPMVSPTREGAHSPGLHVVNTELNPEAVDLPPRFSADNQSTPELSEEPKLGEKQLPEPAEQRPAVESPSNKPKVSTSVQGSSDVKSPTTDKPLGAREIATLNSAAERIDTYNKTRDYWATVDHGLNDWLTATLEANPELTTQTFPTQRVPTASARHRHTGSLALFGKFAGSSSVDLGSDQHNTASAPTPATTSSPTAGAPSGSGFGGRIANQQMQLKGKDLLHTANVLGGKGMTSAKGLFAKGKSRFGREKASSHTRTDSAPSSREVSEEPELVTRRPRAQTGLSAALMRSMTEKEKERQVPNEEMKKRRFSFSSQFRRASRSRSRPSSVALPSEPDPIVGITPKTSPPRELHHFLMGDRRPNSFHAPDSWASHPGVPPTALNEYFNTTPPRRCSSQPRLGILPSPAKSVFSGQDGDTEHHVPPVPPIPDEVAIKHYRRRSSQDSASHRMLQSIIRHSTPPIVPSRQSTPSVVSKGRSLAHAPVFTDDAQSGAGERAEDYKSLLRAPEGSFQPDLPTAESENPHNEGFQFGFTEKAPTGPIDDDDDDDQPPMLNHGPLPVPTPPERHPFFADRHMDVSDEDSDDKPSRGRGISSLPAPNVEYKTDSVNPVLPPPVTLPEKSTIDEESIGAKPNDTSADWAHLHVSNVDNAGQPSVDLGKATLNLATRSYSQAEYPESMLPAAVHRRLDELAVVEGQAGSKDRTSMVESPTLGYCGENMRISEAQEDSPFEPGASHVGDSSHAFDTSPGSERNDATTKPEKPDAERAFSPVWFTKKDLELPAEDSKLYQKETFSSERIVNTDVPQDPDSRAAAKITAPDQQPGATRTDGDLASLSPDPVGANADTSQTRRVATSPSHAVQENAMPSAALWEHRDTAHISHSDADTSHEMNHESSFVTPVAPVPRIVQSGPETPKPGTSHDDSRSAIPNGHARMQNGFPDFKHQAQQLQASSNATTAPERSRSLLSQISAMVSEEGSAPYSQASTERSTPSTIRRMQPESSTKPSIAPAQILEEALTSQGDRPLNGEDDDFDLYADHNGIVKDVQDESGQPLRLIEPQTSGSAPQPQLMKPSAPSIGTAPGSRDGSRPRYSTERPMSFISGPADQDGKPQDQINRAATPEGMRIPPVPQQHRNQIEQHYPPHPPPAGTVYSTNPPSHPNPLWNHDQSIHQPPSALGSHPTKNIFRAVKSINPAGKTTHTLIDHSSPFSQANRQVRPEMTNAHGQPLQDNQVMNQALHRPLAQRDQPIPRGVSDLPPGQSSYRDSGYPDPNRAPRDHHELHQQTQLHANHPHLQNVKNQQLPGPAQPLVHEALRSHEKSSSKPRLSSMFKNFGGRAQGDLQPQSSAGNMTTDPSHKPLPADPSPHTPSHSIASQVVRPREASAETQRQVRSFVPPVRPSIGQQSHFSQDPQFDPKNPRSSVPSNGIPYQLPSSTSTVEGGVHQATRSDVPEGGRKKRFSGLGALFSRGNAGGDGRATKLKLSKEDKKAKKAQQDYIAAPAQPLPSQWIPQQQPSGLAYYPPGQLPPHTVQGMPPAGSKYEPPRFAPDTYSQRPSQQMQPSRQSMSSVRQDEGSAFLRTEQIAEEHQAQQKSRNSLQIIPPTTGFSAQVPANSFDRVPPHLRQGHQGPPSENDYQPDVEHASNDRGAYFATLAARQQHELQRQHEPTRQRDTYAVAQAEQLQRSHQSQPSAYEQSDYRDIRYDQQQAQERAPHHPSDQWAHEAWLAQRQQIQREEEQSVSQRARTSFSDDHQSPHPNQNQYTPQVIHHRSANPHPPFTPRSVSGLGYHGTSQDVAPVSPPAESNLSEPSYEAPPIPAAYSQVSGAFISPLDRQQQPVSPFHQDQPVHASHSDVGRQYSDPRMHVISPQVSAQSQVRSNNRSHSEASTTSIVSPISNPPAIPSTSPPPGVQPTHKPRMSSISEVQQPDRPWHLNFPAGATEQEIVRARQGQYMQELFSAQQQQQAERAAGSPSPRASPENVTPTVVTSPSYSQRGGYREILPRTSPQPYVPPQSASSHHDGSFIPHRGPTPDQSALVCSGQSPQAAAYPLPTSRNSTGTASPFNPIAGGLSPPPLPPPKIPYTPMGPAFPDAQLNSISGNHLQRSSSPGHNYLAPQYDEQVPDEAPPSYDSPGLPNDGMDKNRPDALRPPNIITDLNEDRERQTDSRPRQASIGMLVHPQPASMAASPQRTLSDMGAESLRRQLLQQENLVHMERVQRQKEQREALERERQEREAARARARELERSASGGGQVGSLRSVHGSPNGSAPGWERRGSSHNRPVFELPAVEDDEPTMKATSYPGQEWVPPLWDGD